LVKGAGVPRRKGGRAVNACDRACQEKGLGQAQSKRGESYGTIFDIGCTWGEEQRRRAEGKLGAAWLRGGGEFRVSGGVPRGIVAKNLLAAASQ